MNDHTAGMETGSPLTRLRRSIRLLRASLTLRQQLALLVFVAFLSVQIIVPLVELAGPRPQRFGWQMFSGSREQPSFEIVQTDGSTLAVDVKEYIGYPRLEMEYGKALASHLCTLNHDTVAVRILREDSDSVEERSCRQ